MTLTAISFIRAVTAVVGAVTLPADGYTEVVVTSKISQRITGHPLCWKTKSEMDRLKYDW